MGAAVTRPARTWGSIRIFVRARRDRAMGRTAAAVAAGEGDPRDDLRGDDQNRRGGEKYGQSLFGHVGSPEFEQ